jgi:ankyrin repeat protein
MTKSNKKITQDENHESSKKPPDKFDDNPDTSERSSSGKSTSKDNQKNIDILVKTVNNMDRIHEALAFLNDDSRSLEEKRASVMKQNSHGITALFWAVRSRADHSLVKKMVEIGGKELVLITNKYGENVLHNAAFCGSQYDVYKTILDAGEKELLLQRDRFGNTAMHYSCAWGVSIRAIEYMADMGGQEALMVKNNKGDVPYLEDIKLQEEYLLEIGGIEYKIQLLEQKNHSQLSFVDMLMLNKLEQAEIRLDDKKEVKDLLTREDANGLNSLMVAIWFVGNSSPIFHSRLTSLIRKMVRKGGKELVLKTNKTNSSVLHYAAFNGAPLDIIKLLVETGGQDTLKKQNEWGSTPLHDSCFRHAPVEVIEYLVQQGGVEALKATNKYGMTPLAILFNADILSDIHIMTLQHAWYELDPHCSRDCSRKIVKTTLEWADCLDPKLLRNNNFVKALLNDRFIMNRYLIVVFTDLYAQLGLVLALSPGLIAIVYGDQRSHNTTLDELRDTFMDYTIPILILCVIWFIGRELVQIFASSFQNYLKGYDNFIDVTQLILVCMTIHTFLQAKNKDEDRISDESTGILICTAAVAWTQLLFAIGHFSYNVSLFTYALVQVSRHIVLYKVSHPNFSGHCLTFSQKSNVLFRFPRLF